MPTFYIVPPRKTQLGESGISIAGISGVKTNLPNNAPITSFGALMLDEAYSPIWSGTHTFNGSVIFNGSVTFNNPSFNIGSLFISGQTLGDLITFNGVSWTRLGISTTSGAILTSTGTTATWSTVVNVSTTITNNLTVGSLSGVLKATAGVVSGSSSIDDLSDVDVSVPVSNQVLKYNAGLSKWQNSNVPLPDRSIVIILLNGATPIDLGADQEIASVPFEPSDGVSSLVFSVTRITFTLEKVATTGDCTIRVQKVAANQLFPDPTDPAAIFIATLTLTAGNNTVSINKTSPGFNESLASGQRVRVVVDQIGTDSEGWSVQIEASATSLYQQPSGVVPISMGGTGRSTIGPAHSVLTVGKDGDKLIYKQLVSGTNVNITSTPILSGGVEVGGTITISASGGGGGGGGTGDVGFGNVGEIAYYASAGIAVSGATDFVWSDTNKSLSIIAVPSTWSSSTISLLIGTSSFTNGSPNGTVFGINIPSSPAFTGNFADFQFNDLTRFKIDYTGKVETRELKLTATTISLNTTSGALVVAGGAGISGALHLGSPLGVTSGGTGVTSPTNGQLLIGNSSNTFTLAQLQGTGGIAITNGSGSISIGYSGLTTLNGLNATTQVFATSTSGTDFQINSSGTTHTFVLPNAAADARGLVSTGTQTFNGFKTFNTGLKSPKLHTVIDGYFGGDPALFLTGGDTGKVYFGIKKSDDFDLFTGIIVEHKISPLGAPQLYGDIVFKTAREYNAELSTERLRIDGAGLITAANNVTINGILSLPNNPLAFSSGGTGYSTYSAGDILFGITGGSLTKAKLEGIGVIEITYDDIENKVLVFADVGASTGQGIINPGVQYSLAYYNQTTGSYELDDAQQLVYSNIGPHLRITAASSSATPLLLKGASGQTVSLFDIQNNNSTSLFKISASGVVNISNASQASTVNSGALQIAGGIGVGATSTMQALTLIDELEVGSGGTGRENFALNRLIVSNTTSITGALDISAFIEHNTTNLTFLPNPAKPNATNSFELRFVEVTNNRNNYIAFKAAPSMATTYTFIWPHEAPFQGAFLTANVIGNSSVIPLYWSTSASLTLTEPLPVASGGTGTSEFEINRFIVSSSIAPYYDLETSVNIKHFADNMYFERFDSDSTYELRFEAVGGGYVGIKGPPTASSGLMYELPNNSTIQSGGSTVGHVLSPKSVNGSVSTLWWYELIKKGSKYTIPFFTNDTGTDYSNVLENATHLTYGGTNSSDGNIFTINGAGLSKIPFKIIAGDTQTFAEFKRSTTANAIVFKSNEITLNERNDGSYKLVFNRQDGTEHISIGSSRIQFTNYSNNNNGYMLVFRRFNNSEHFYIDKNTIHLEQYTDSDSSDTMSLNFKKKYSGDGFYQKHMSITHDEIYLRQFSQNFDPYSIKFYRYNNNNTPHILIGYQTSTYVQYSTSVPGYKLAFQRFDGSENFSVDEDTINFHQFAYSETQGALSLNFKKRYSVNGSEVNQLSLGSSEIYLRQFSDVSNPYSINFHRSGGSKYTKLDYKGIAFQEFKPTTYTGDPPFKFITEDNSLSLTFYQHSNNEFYSSDKLFSISSSEIYLRQYDADTVQPYSINFHRNDNSKYAKIDKRGIALQEFAASVISTTEPYFVTTDNSLSLTFYKHSGSEFSSGDKIFSISSSEIYLKQYDTNATQPFSINFWRANNTQHLFLNSTTFTAVQFKESDPSYTVNFKRFNNSDYFKISSTAIDVRQFTVNENDNPFEITFSKKFESSFGEEKQWSIGSSEIYLRQFSTSTNPYSINFYKEDGNKHLGISSSEIYLRQFSTSTNPYSINFYNEDGNKHLGISSSEIYLRQFSTTSNFAINFHKTDNSKHLSIDGSSSSYYHFTGSTTDTTIYSFNFHETNNSNPFMSLRAPHKSTLDSSVLKYDINLMRPSKSITVQYANNSTAYTMFWTEQDIAVQRIISVGRPGSGGTQQYRWQAYWTPNVSGEEAVWHELTPEQTIQADGTAKFASFNPNYSTVVPKGNFVVLYVRQGGQWQYNQLSKTWQFFGPYELHLTVIYT